MTAVAGTAPLTLVTARDEGQASVVWVIGELDDLAVGRFESECERVVSRSRFLVVELSSCSSLSGAGLQALARLQQRLPGAVALVTDDPHFEKLLRIAGLRAQLPCFADLLDAITAADERAHRHTRSPTTAPPESLSDHAA